MTRSSRLAAAAIALLASAASAHPQGFHTKLTFTLTKTTVSGLVVMDVDSGQRCAVLRQSADADGDGLVKGEEVTALKDRLAQMALRTLKLALSGAALSLTTKDTKLSLHDDPRVGEPGLSIAVLVEVPLTKGVSEGMTFEVSDTSPDLSTIVVQVFQPTEPPFQVELESGKTAKVRLGRLP